jgi:tetratricopeptide (TPR) repeat protein
LTFLSLAWGQAAPTAKPPTVKSQAEAEAIKAIFSATDADSRIKAADALLVKFADTEFKAIALMIAAVSYQQKNDVEKMMVYAERTLQADPNNYNTMLMLAAALAQRTREFDLDREEKLDQSEKYARKAIELLKTALKPNPTLTDEQWEGVKKDLNAQAHEALGMGAMVRKKYDVAITEFKIAIEVATVPDAATMVRLGAVYNQAGKHDDAVAILDKVLNTANVHPQIKQFAQAEKVRALQAKGAVPTPGATTVPAPAPAQPEAKKP